MGRQKLFKQATVAALVLLGGAWGLHAQEAPPPPSPPAGVGGHIFFTHMTEGPGGKVVTEAPYSAQAITETTQTLADGNKIHQQTTAKVCRDSQGRTRREETLGNLGPWSAAETHPQQLITINDPVADVSYILNPAQHMAFKMPARKGSVGYMAFRKGGAGAPPPGEGADVMFMSTPGVPVPPPVDGPEAGKGAVFVQKQAFVSEGKGHEGITESLGTQIIESVEATGTRTTLTIPVGQIGNEQPLKIVTERWYSPLLQMVVKSTRSDPRLGVTTYRLTNINLDEPSPDLFQLPADYTLKEGPATFKLAKPAMRSSTLAFMRQSISRQDSAGQWPRYRDRLGFCRVPATPARCL